MAYTTIDDPTIYFTTNLRSGLYGGSDTAFDIGFQPDWIWNKKRSGTGVHSLFDSVRGFGSSGKVLYSNTNGAEATNALIKSVSSTGFTVTASSDDTGTMVDWCWKAGGSASSNSNGSITSSVSASTDAGFSIVSYTGNGTSGATVGHGISTPDVIIAKSRSGTHNWYVYHKSNGVGYGKLNLTDAFNSATDVFTVAPTSSVFTISADTSINNSGDNFIAYCFTEKKGYSKFGSYTGNGNADGTFVYTGFKPAFVLLKYSSAAGNNWFLYDNKRPGYNEIDQKLYANATDAEEDSQYNNMDFLSNGFKLRTTDGDSNASGGTYIYMAFAESPFVNSNGVPNNAR